MESSRRSPPSHTPIFRDRMRSLAEQLQAHEVLLPTATNVEHIDINQEMEPNMAPPHRPRPPRRPPPPHRRPRRRPPRRPPPPHRRPRRRPPPLNTCERKQESPSSSPKYSDDDGNQRELLVAQYLGDDYGNHGELPMATEVTEVVPYDTNQEMLRKIAASIEQVRDNNYWKKIHNDPDHGGRRKKKRRKRKAESRKRKSRKRKSRKRKSRKRKSRKRKSRKRKANRRTKRKH